MSNLCLISHPWYDVEKLKVPGGCDLNLSLFRSTSKSFVLKRWKKNVLHFVLLNYIAKVSPKSSGEGRLYWHAEVRSLLSKLIFTHIVSRWTRSHEIVDYHQTLKGRVASRISERFKAQKISGVHWLNDSWTRWIWTLTRGFELVARGFKLVTREFELAYSCIWTRTFEFQLVLLTFQLVTRNS